MKKKIFIAMATLFFAAIAFYNVQVSQHNGDISLEYVALMAQANSESGGATISCSGTHNGLGNGYWYCPTCTYVPYHHPDSWTTSRCSL